MANSEHLVRLLRDVEGWNRWRRERPEEQVDLSGADLSGADLNRADLSEADFSWADLSGADLSGADLSGADFLDATLATANFHGAMLTGADFSGANISAANLSRADLSAANFSSAHAGYTTFADVDLSVAKGLESVVHLAPSTIGIDTIYRSRGKILEIFLRGAGIPDTFITYIGSLVGKPIEYYSCFISYSTKDQDFAERLYADLQAVGVRCWYAPHDMAAGKKVHEQIDEAIRLHERLLLIVSPASIRSEWVKNEFTKACKREDREKRRVLFPIRLMEFEFLGDWECLDPDTGKDLAREVRGYFIPDFSQWKDHDSYQLAFQRLLRDLKADAAKSESAQ